MKQPIKQGFYKTTLATAVAAVSAGSIMVVPQVYAQEAEAVEEIIVTATRRDTTVQDVPYNITAVSGDALEKANIKEVSELMRSLPGVQYIDRDWRSGGVVNGILMRGVNIDAGTQGDVQLSAAPSVATYVNNTPLFVGLSLRDIERVEVLRGPQGTLYGSGALGGAVRYIQRAPKMGEFEASVSGYYSQTEGSEGWNHGVDGIVNIPMGEKLAARMSYGTLNRAGIIDYANAYVLDGNGVPALADPADVANSPALYQNIEDADEVNVDYARASLRFEPNDKFSAQLDYFTQAGDAGGRRQQTESMDDYEFGGLILEPSERELDLVSLELEVDLGFATLTSSTSEYDNETIGVTDNTGFYANAGFGFYYAGSPRPLSRATRTFDDSSFVQEVRLVSNTEGKVDWILGAYYQDQDLGMTQLSETPGLNDWVEASLAEGIPTYIDEPWLYDVGANWYSYWWGMDTSSDVDWRYSRQMNYVEKAFFGEVTYHLSDTWQVTAGARKFDVESDIDSRAELPFWGMLDEFDQSFSDSDTIFKLNTSVDITETDMAYATWSQGYRRGGANAVSTSGPFPEDPGLLSYGADTVDNFEVGVKGTLNRRLQYNAALFRVNWDNVQLNTAGPISGYFVVVNGEEAVSQGVELSLNGQFTDTLDGGVSYTYVDAELTEDILFPGQATSSREAGSRLPGIPEHAVTARLGYLQGLNNGLSLYYQVNGYYQSETENSASSNPREAATFDGFALLNASVSLSSDAWNMDLFVKNLTNDEGITGARTGATWGPNHAGSQSQWFNYNYANDASSSFITMPRTLGMSASYRF
ncbi:TonB-dependent receptor [Microbulbifer pacificus]|uniref:TonB-dependent receptor n=1 Tax=Microbulbifer pacificus TaxID=407164 RepID=UPI000CF4C7EE|nr:TonB-dependent receptor [Microbulbifer pacificus]